jgi:hypothetical protein
MNIFNIEFDVYDYHYTYDEMKVVCVIGSYDNVVTEDLDYEDCMRISSAIYWHWVDGRDASEDEKYAKYPWLEFETREEEYYIQAYTQRVLPEFIKLYKKTNKNTKG